ncbi:unnamed protein product [Brachionus calyciflorus]|uniref:DDE-1 domain-containing protein n=1 Tax=Brachionus calyciflorus TaxID=104777 RepID=A0A814PVR5_9BILA|nr:unnamed protein product [Brachionus calyciflorus]
MDETCSLDFPSSYTFTFRGAKRVKASTTGSERARISAAFTATAAGEELPILVLVPRSTELPDYEPPENVVIIYKTLATFNEDILFIDSARSHQTKLVQNKFKEFDIETVFIPPRLTNLLQPADVSWFGKIKKEYNEKWNDWFMNSDLA